MAQTVYPAVVFLSRSIFVVPKLAPKTEGQLWPRGDMK